jgi:integrase
MVVRHAARRAGLPVLGPHQLRHRAATATLRHGAPLPEVARLLRHRTLAVTASYARADPAALRDLALPWPGGDA